MQPFQPRPRKLLDQVRDVIRTKHNSYRTEQTYVQSSVSGSFAVAPIGGQNRMTVRASNAYTIRAILNVVYIETLLSLPPENILCVLSHQVDGDPSQ